MAKAARRKVEIVNKLGLHARAAAKFVNLASQFEAEIRLCKDGREVNAKSIMGIMLLAAGKGTELEIIAWGKKADKVVDKLAELVRDRFGEEE